MKTLGDLHGAIQAQKVGSLTLSVAANGKALASATFAPSFTTEHAWGDSIAEAIVNVMARAIPEATAFDDFEALL